MFDTLMKLDENREILDFYATDKRAIEELLNKEKFRTTVYEPSTSLWQTFSRVK